MIIHPPGRVPGYARAVEVLRTHRACIERAARLGRPVLVPTMGALHAGHAALIRRGADLARDANLPAGCMVTIFVNPTQFNDPADFARYPKTLDADLALCEAAGAACVLAPDVPEVYPPEAPPPVPDLPRVATAPGLEDRHRPGHFAGVCQVVARLFTITNPAAAVFGEKDWQQLRVIAALAARGFPDLRIVPAPTIREPDGLAMSSRNRFLSPDDRARSRAISMALCECQAAGTPADAERAMRDILADAGLSTEYAVVRDAETLEPPGVGVSPLRALVAARAGSVRLIDNAPWEPPSARR